MTPVMEKQKRERRIIDLCASDDSFDISIEEPPKKKTKRTQPYLFEQANEDNSIEEPPVKKTKRKSSIAHDNVNKDSQELDLTTVHSYGQWHEFIPMETTYDKEKRRVFKMVSNALLIKARKRHQKNIKLKRDWDNPYLTALESLHKCAWVFEVIPNLTGDLEKTFKGIGKGCTSIILDQVQKCGGLNLWSETGTNRNNLDVLKFIGDRTKADTCKPFLIFLRDNSEIILTEHNDIVNIFKRDLDVQMLISGYWFQKHATVVTWKNW